MARILFTNVSIFDGTGAAPYAGEALVEGNRIYNSEARSGMQSQGVFMNSRPTVGGKKAQRVDADSRNHVAEVMGAVDRRVGQHRDIEE